MDYPKRDLSVTFGDRTFSVRAYHDSDGPGGPGWHAVIIEDRTPLHYDQRPHANGADCFAQAVRFLATMVEDPGETPPLPAHPGTGEAAPVGTNRTPAT
jgi:hypothetical protein